MAKVVETGKRQIDAWALYGVNALPMPNRFNVELMAMRRLHAIGHAAQVRACKCYAGIIGIRCTQAGLNNSHGVLVYKRFFVAGNFEIPCDRLFQLVK
jgi:hypothetical protein